MKSFIIIFFDFCFNLLTAHKPYLSNLLIYEQNEKKLLLIKSSLTVIELEIKYNYKNHSCKTPLEFIKLIEIHFHKNCFITINDKIIKYKNLQVILGHETSILAELIDVPNKINSILVQNTFFKDMPNYKCEVMFSASNFPKKQCVIENSNNKAINLLYKDNQWTYIEKDNFLLIYIVFLIIITIFSLTILSLLLFKLRT